MRIARAGEASRGARDPARLRWPGPETPAMRPVLFALVAAALSGCAAAPAASGVAAWTEGVRFAPMGGAERAEATYLAGAGKAAGPYTIRVHIAKGGGIAPHTHPDARTLTVVAGAVYYGFGETVDLANAKLYRAGAVFTVPANAPHWASAPDGDVVYQESGMGPTAFTPVKQAGAPAARP